MCEVACRDRENCIKRYIKMLTVYILLHNVHALKARVREIMRNMGSLNYPTIFIILLIIIIIIIRLKRINNI